MATAAAELGISRRTIQRWRKRPGAPFDSDGACELEELRAWASAHGLFELGPQGGRPPEVDRLAGAIASEPTGSPPPPPPPVDRPKGGAPRPATNPEDVALDGLSESDKAVLRALIQGDAESLVDLAAKVTPALLRRLALLGRTWHELADAHARELDNQKRLGELVSLDEVKGAWGAQVEIVKGHFQALPGKLAPRLVEQPYEVVYRVLEEELHQVLETFSRKVPGS